MPQDQGASATADRVLVASRPAPVVAAHSGDAPLRAGAVAYARGVIPSEDRERDDFYPTPASATRALLHREPFVGPVWEPACGDGAISKVLEAAGHEVISTDLIERGYGQARVDFLMESRLLAPNIVTNPPFKHALEFVERSLDLGARKVAMMLRLAWLEGIERRRLFESTPLARVHVASRRLAMNRGGEAAASGAGGMISFAWFVWDRHHTGPAQLHWFDWQEHPEATTIGESA